MTLLNVLNVITAFDPEQVPHNTIADFLHWYDLTTEWLEDRDYDSTEGTSPALVSWYRAMSSEFAPVVAGASGTTRYIIGSTCVYARFADSIAVAAHQRGRELAQELGLGIYVAGSGECILADGRVIS